MSPCLKGRCCTRWKKFLRGFLKFIMAIVEAFATLLFAILRAILSVIRLALMIAEVAVGGCVLGLRLAIKVGRCRVQVEQLKPPLKGAGSSA